MSQRPFSAPDEGFLSASAAARTLGVTHRAVTLWIDQGALPALDGDGRARRIRVVDLERFHSRSRFEAEAAA